MSTFFFQRLLSDEYNYEDVRKWTTKLVMFSWSTTENVYVNISQLEYIIIPTNSKNEHWFLIVLDMRRKIMRIFDSLKKKLESYDVYVKALQKWINDEAQDKTIQSLLLKKDGSQATPFEVKIETCYQQRNGTDCGLHTIMNADLVADDMHPSVFENFAHPFSANKVDREDYFTKYRELLLLRILRLDLEYPLIALRKDQMSVEKLQFEVPQSSESHDIEEVNSSASGLAGVKRKRIASK
jgi:Ulp1 family protease